MNLRRGVLAKIDVTAIEPDNAQALWLVKTVFGYADRELGMHEQLQRRKVARTAFLISVSRSAQRGQVRKDAIGKGFFKAGEEDRTPDIQLGKLTFYR